MESLTKVLMLVTARSGSKSVPNKNILPFGSHTPISLRIKSVQLASPAADIVISTDSSVYAEIAVNAGARAPFMRPDSLATDTASSHDVIKHALDQLESLGFTYDFLVLIEPSSPFCRPVDIKKGLELLRKSNGPVVSVRETSPNPIFIAELGPSGEFYDVGKRLRSVDLRRQSLPKSFTPNGCFYGIKVSDYRKSPQFYNEQTKAFSMPPEYSIEIDEPHDALYAQWLWEKNIIDRSLWRDS